LEIIRKTLNKLFLGGQTMKKNLDNIETKKSGDDYDKEKEIIEFPYQDPSIYDYDEALKEIYTNRENQYIKFPNAHVAYNIACSLGYGDNEDEYEEGIFQDIDNDVDYQKSLMYYFKSSFKQGFLDREEEAKRVANEQWNNLLIFLLVQKIFCKD
jgi:hypothetical protein